MFICKWSAICTFAVRSERLAHRRIAQRWQENGRGGWIWPAARQPFSRVSHAIAATQPYAVRFLTLRRPRPKAQLWRGKIMYTSRREQQTEVRIPVNPSVAFDGTPTRVRDARGIAL